MRTITGIRGFRVPQGASFNTRQSFEMPHGRSATQRTVPPCFPSEKGEEVLLSFFLYRQLISSLFSLPFFRFLQCFVRFRQAEHRQNGTFKRWLQPMDGLIGETIDWPRSGNFFSIDLRSVGSVNFLYILRALSCFLPSSKPVSSSDR